MNRLWLALLFLLWQASAALAAAPPPANSTTSVRIGYIDLRNDPRYRTDNSYTGIVFHTLGRPYPGAELGVQDAKLIGRVIGRTFVLERKSAATAADLPALAKELAAEGDHFIIADLTAPDLLKLADSLRGQPALVMNVSAREDSLRGADCRQNVVHLIPSESMLTDALVQYLVVKNWKDILALQGPAKEDAGEIVALQHSARKFGATVDAVRPFVLGTDPRHRDENNVALMTANSDADVIFVADSGGEFARYVPFETHSPRPVVGDAGLMPVAWHWTWYGNGAPQLQHRFEKLASPRRMNQGAWAAWAAVKAITQSVMRVRSGDFSKVEQFMLGSKINIDGAKGKPMSFRPWDHQLRQPILLVTADAVIARAPLPQYLHQTNDLDTLGYDAPESACHF
jgi:ABC transporter substrate binding protein (PQQ-dependent alcohol dehydrogenase system)